ncbi:hypothetical protein LIER_23029 [Lithospermum erythrorhizon]|uniref:DUF4283 domain-containing protein n=1 Tax=Lithospermum erythrorhizon TaxID=34254 RepID=A0AAV3QX84_LITER
MADGEQIQSPPPHEVGVDPPINTSLSYSKPPLFSAFTQGQRKKQSQPLAVNTKAQSLEDGEIPPSSPLMCHQVPLHNPLKKSNPFITHKLSKVTRKHFLSRRFRPLTQHLYVKIHFLSSLYQSLKGNLGSCLKALRRKPSSVTINDISLRPVEGIWLKVFYDVVPPYCTYCLHIGHHVDVCKKGKSLILAEVAQPVEKLGLGNSAFKVFDESSQPGAPSIFAPSTSIPAGVNYKDEQKATQSQIWIEVQGTNVLKSQKMTTYHKDKDLPTKNKFSSVLLPASSGSDICVDSTVLLSRTGLAKETYKIKGVQLVAKNGDAQTVLQVENEAIPQDALVVQNSPKQLSEQSGNKVNNHVDGSENLVATQLVENKVCTSADSVDEEEQQTKAKFNELVARQECNKGLPLKHKAIVKSDKTQKITKIDTEAKKSVDIVEKEKIPRTEQQGGKKQHISKDDSYVKQIMQGKHSNKQGNSHTNLPPNVDFMFPNDEGIENGINYYHKPGIMLLARRSLSPIGRSSPKLVSLRKKVKYIEIGEDNTVMHELTGHSEEYQSAFEKVCRNKSSSHGEKQPSPNGPG